MQGGMGKGKGKKEKFYAVAVGRRPGIYTSWQACQPQVHQFKAAAFKSFGTLREAERYLADRGAALPEPGAPPEAQAQEEQAQEAQRDEPPAPRPAPAAAPAKRSHEEAFAREPFTVAPDVLHRLEFDGGARRNPGPAGAGAVLYVDSSSDEVGRVCVGLGHATNNFAEYSALVHGLEAAVQVGVRRLRVQGDSNLVVLQMRGAWRVKHEELRPLFLRARELQLRFAEFSIQHVYRDANKVADALSNEAIDTGGWAGLKTAEGILPVAVGSAAAGPQPKQRKLGVAAAGASAGAAGAAAGLRGGGSSSPPASPQLCRSLWGAEGAPGRAPRKALAGGSWAARRPALLTAAAPEGRRRLPAAARGCAAAACLGVAREPSGCAALEAPGPLLWREWGGLQQARWQAQGGAVLPGSAGGRGAASVGGECQAVRQPRGLLALVACSRWLAAGSAVWRQQQRGQLLGAACQQLAPAPTPAPAAAGGLLAGSRLCSCTGLALRMVRARALV